MLSANLKTQLEFHPRAKLNIFNLKLLSNSFRVISYWGARQCPTTDSCTTTLSLFLVFSTVDSCFVALLLVHCLSLFTCLFCHFKLWYINRNKSFVTIELIDGTVFHLISENLIRVLFCREKIRLTHAIAGKQRANSHNFKIKKFKFTYNYFPCHLLSEQK